MAGTYGITRRSALVGASAGGGVLLLAACSSSAKDDPTVAATTATATDPSSAATSSAATSSAATSEAETPTAATSAPAASGTKVVALADVPVGGAVSATGKGNAKLIVAQPTAGKVVAFSAICTHQGCTVAPAKTELDCPCHGSKFDLLTGKVTNPPATEPLASVAVSVVDGNVVQA